MPIGLDPNARTTIYLKADMERPPEQRVGFLCRFITCRQREEIRNKALEAMREETSADDSTRLLREALAIGVIGPVKEGVPCTIAGCEEILTPRELWDLLLEYPNAVGASEVDLKKSGSDTPSSSGTSATGQ